MKIPYLLFISLWLAGCQGSSAFFQDADDVLTDNVVKIEVNKGAMKVSTDVDVQLTIKNSAQVAK